MQLYYHTLLRFRFNWKLFWFFELIDHIDWLFCAFLYFEKLDRKVRMVSAREQNRLCQSGEGNGNEMVQRNRERDCQTLMSLLHGRVYYYAEWWENGNGMNETWDKHGNARRRRKNNNDDDWEIGTCKWQIVAWSKAERPIIVNWFD